jgi:hypothetical protein
MAYLGRDGAKFPEEECGRGILRQWAENTVITAVAPGKWAKPSSLPHAPPVQRGGPSRDVAALATVR